MTPCAWCLLPLAAPAVSWHDVPFHAACWARRQAVLRPEPVALADWVVEELE